MQHLEIPELRVFRSAGSADSRGRITSIYNRAYFESVGIADDFVQENHCLTRARGTVRGFHFQTPPFGQSKLIRVLQGRILDVNVDLRRGSPTYGRHAKVELSPDGWNQIYVPVGFADCYATLDDDVATIFKLGCGYAPEHAGGLAWNDPDLAIDWPFPPQGAIVLPRDLDRPRFSTLPAIFDYPGDAR